MQLITSARAHASRTVCTNNNGENDKLISGNDEKPNNSDGHPNARRTADNKSN